METESRFKIIFVKLTEALAQKVSGADSGPPDPSSEEMDEIDNLRRLVQEISDPEPAVYTTT